ncbi:MAG TPA: DUF58 domain-containing protein [Candidatus Agrococcus pullicola]|uniref:DUF58 domain-containing protein n=1 Tax=Candidatus Agrococcus pullicola TaxID=2838429 RepID=A0A9D1YW01_9MICO|nr:DUF58 domain-containing protein [Candidatus Agrococcus pullicola]
MKVKTRMRIHAHRKTIELLDGEYSSIHHGRSHDFDDLREYAPGDEVKDIDWKATARSNVPLIKRYIASRQHNIVFVVDTGRGMAAVGESGEPKSEIAIQAVGVLAYLATRHGDRAALFTGNSDNLDHMPQGGSEAHIERMLRRIDESITLQSPQSDMTFVLTQVARRLKHRSIVFIVADDILLNPDMVTQLGRLHARHEVMWVSVGDADLMARSAGAPAVWGVDTRAELPDFVRRSRKLQRVFDRGVEQRRDLLEGELRKKGVAGIRIGSIKETVPSLFRLLERHRRASRA